MLRLFRAPVLWLSLVLLLGSAQFGAQQTKAWVVPILKRVAPHATVAELRAVHMMLRKVGHVTEYAILAFLWLRAFLLTRRLSLRTASWAALLLCIGCAFIDEAHQSMLPSRTGSVGDAVLDTLGALMLLMIVRTRAEARLPAPVRAPAGAYEPGG